MSYTTFKDSGAFRLLCKAKGLQFDEYNHIAKDLDKYRQDTKWKDLIEESKVYIGVVESVSPSPCSMLLYDKKIRFEVGLLKIGDMICCNLDGYNCDKYKYLKNDLLTVTVWQLIRQTCELAKINIPTINELECLLDEKTFDIYKNKLTCTINQVDSDFATNLVSRYTINNVAEMSAFVAAIRPGFASLLNNFIERKPYSTGVAKLDDILKDSYHYLMYQESIMKYLIWLGIEESESYDIIKKISKKKFKEKELKKLKSKLQLGWEKQVGKIDGFEDTWIVVEDAASYSFNASHSLSYAYDSLYVAYLKAHYPYEYFSVAFNLYNDDIARTKRLTDELQYFNISLKNPKFRYSKDTYFFDKNKRAIFKGIESIKFLNSEVAKYLYSLKDKQYDSFTDLLIDLQGKITSRQLTILIELDYFLEFGESQKLLNTVELFNNIYTKKHFKKDGLICSVDILKKYAKSETEKTFKEVDTRNLLKELESSLENISIPITNRIKSWIEYTGTCNLSDTNYSKNIAIVIDINTKYSPKLQLYNINTAKIAEVKIKNELLTHSNLKLFDTIQILKINSKNKKRLIDNTWQEIDEKEYWLDNYIIIEE
jgi:DNA polymerase III alpha subunit